MEIAELKKQIKKRHLDRRELAKKLNVSPGYLNQMLSGWAPLKGEYETIILQELEKGKNGNKKRS